MATEFKPLSVTIPRALALTGIGRSKLYDLFAKGRVRKIKVDGRTLVDYDDLVRLVSCESEGGSDDPTRQPRKPKPKPEPPKRRKRGRAPATLSP